MIEPIDLTPVPPEQAIQYLLSKELQISWDWHDMWQADHARAFTVAKMTKVDILQDVFTALDEAQKQGTTFEEFQKNLTPVLQEKGWWGRQEAVDVTTGEVSTVQLGSLRRLRTIFNVNIQTSLQVGHYRAMTEPAVLQALPYWRYSPVNDSHTRPQHWEWRVVILPANHPWFQTHFPPNGWGCRCTIVAMSLRQIERAGLKVTEAPPMEMFKWTNPKTGKEVWVPKGVDPGWAYNPGESANANAIAVAKEKAQLAPEPIRMALLADLERGE